MQTSVTENELDLSELDALIREADNQVAVLQSQISALEKENADLLKKIAEASVEDAAAYRQQYNSNRTRIEELKSELAEWQQKQKEYADAKQEAEAENDVPTDDYYRLPAIMQDCKTAYSVIFRFTSANVFILIAFLLLHINSAFPVAPSQAVRHTTGGMKRCTAWQELVWQRYFRRLLALQQRLIKSCCRRSVMLFLPRDVQNSTSFREKATAASTKA